MEEVQKIMLLGTMSCPSHTAKRQHIVNYLLLHCYHQEMVSGYVSARVDFFFKKIYTYGGLSLLLFLSSFPHFKGLFVPWP